jgi:hypothetical protein
MAIHTSLDHRGDTPPHIQRLRQQLSDLLDSLGPNARACGPTAAALHGFDGFRLSLPFHIVVPRGHNLQRVGHHIHTSTVLPPIDCETVDGIRVTSPTRTLIDSAWSATAEQLTAALDGALRDLKTTEPFLHQRIVDLRGRGRYGTPLLLRVIEGVEITRGAHSWLEREFLRLVDTAHLPAPTPQQVMGQRNGTLIRVDFHFPGTRLIVEVLGYRYHRTKLQMQIDAERMNRLSLLGYLVLQFTYDHVVADAETVVEQIATALVLSRAAA